MSILYKYAYSSSSTWKDDCERKCYAQMLRYVVAARGRTEALKIVDESDNAIDLTDFGNKPVTVEADITYRLGYFVNRSMTLIPNGAAGDMIVYESYNDISRQKSEGYLAGKYGLKGNLPSTHRYKNTVVRP